MAGLSSVLLLKEVRKTIGGGGGWMDFGLEENQAGGDGWIDFGSVVERGEK